MADEEQPLEDPKARPKRPGWLPALLYLAAVAAALFWWQGVLTELGARTIPYSDFRQHLTRGEIERCLVGEQEISGRVTPRSETDAADDYFAAEDRPASDEGFEFRTVRVDDPELVEALAAAGVEFSGRRTHPLLGILLAWILPLGLIIALWLFVARGAGSPGASLMGFGKSRAKLVADRDVGVSFDDVAGCDEAKRELAEIVDFLRDPDRFKALGAHIPTGVLVVGPPGTGKTLIARAVAGEAGVPFFSLSGSDFVEMFVGVGAARVRDLFAQAKAVAPCIVFIDELDAVGRRRGVHIGNVNDERENTLNQLLVELDGFEPNSGVILLSATNRPDVLDPALLRPGRFDRQVVLDSPDARGRKAILEVHSRDKPVAPDVDFDAIARSTPGFSGADLANAVNEAALLAVREHKSQIDSECFEEAIEKVVAGPEQRSRRLDEMEKRRVAVHESGHAIVAAHCKHADPVHKISIVPRGRAALGYTLQLPTGDRHLLSRSDVMDRLKGLLGGRAAEEVMMGEVSTGAENDLEAATALARQAIGRFGMGESVGLMHCEHVPGAALVEAGVEMQRDCSEATACAIDGEVKKLLDDSYAECLAILTRHRDELDRVSRVLLEKETLDREEFEAIRSGATAA